MQNMMKKKNSYDTPTKVCDSASLAPASDKQLNKLGRRNDRQHRDKHAGAVFARGCSCRFVDRLSGWLPSGYL